MVNFAKLSKVPPKRRMAAALRGFGFGNVRSTAQHLRGLGMTNTEIVAQSMTASTAPKTITAIREAFQSAVSPQSFTRAAPTLVRVTAPVLKSIDTSVAPAPRNVPRTPPPAVDQTQVEDTEREVQRFGKGREEEYIPAEEVEDGGENWSQPDGGEGGGGSGSGGSEFAQGTPGDGSEPSVVKKSVTGSKALVQSGGLVAQLSALPMPVKVIGGIAAVYIVWQVLK